MGVYPQAVFEGPASRLCSSEPNSWTINKIESESESESEFSTELRTQTRLVHQVEKTRRPRHQKISDYHYHYHHHPERNAHPATDIDYQLDILVTVVTNLSMGPAHVRPAYTSHWKSPACL
jgi:hypothetical protein